MPPVIFLMGPTASGKTDLALELAERLPCDIISADSALVYRGMDIGTAKPGREILDRVPHRLIDIRDPSEAYSVARFREDALHAMAEITAAGRIPLLVGGTMLYFHALYHGLTDLPGADLIIRARLRAEAQAGSWPNLHARLAEVDQCAAERIHPNDSQRIERALELYELTGIGPTELYMRGTAKTLPYRVTRLILAPGDRQILRDRITTRFHAMLEQGFIGEVKALRERGDLSTENSALRAAGYRQMWDYLGDKMNCEQMTKSAIIATHQLAKRQLTWLRAEPKATWLDSLDNHLLDKALRRCNDAGLSSLNKLYNEGVYAHGN